MTTQLATAFETGCWFRLVLDRGVVYALTVCCGKAADWTGYCECGRRVPEGYTYAALVGSRTFRRDLRQMMEAFGCDVPGVCAGEIVDRFVPVLDTA